MQPVAPRRPLSPFLLRRVAASDINKNVITRAAGLARTPYASVVAKGHDVRFAADTPIELELAPGPSTTESRVK